MTNSPETAHPAGFIVIWDNQIWGFGSDEDSARADFIRSMEWNGLSVASARTRDEDGYLAENEVLIEDTVLHPASKSLIDTMESNGKRGAWRMFEGIAYPLQFDPAIDTDNRWRDSFKEEF